MFLSGKCMSCLVMHELDIAHWIPLTLVRRERIIHNQIRVTGQALPFTQTKRAYRKGSKLCMVHPIFRVARLSQLMCLFSFKIEKLSLPPPPPRILVFVQPPRSRHPFLSVSIFRPMEITQFRVTTRPIPLCFNSS